MREVRLGLLEREEGVEDVSAASNYRVLLDSGRCRHGVGPCEVVDDGNHSQFAASPPPPPFAQLAAVPLLQPHPPTPLPPSLLPPLPASLHAAQDQAHKEEVRGEGRRGEGLRSVRGEEEGASERVLRRSNWCGSYCGRLSSCCTIVGSSSCPPPRRLVLVLLSESTALSTDGVPSRCSPSAVPS